MNKKLREVGVCKMISCESIIPDIIPDEKKPLEPLIWTEEYDDKYEDASNYGCPKNCFSLGDVNFRLKL